MNCREFGPRIEDYLSETLDEVERASFRDHLTSCAQCRSHACSVDASLLLVSLRPQVEDEQAVRACTEAVTMLIGQDRLQRRLAARPRRGWMAAAAAAVIVVTGGIGWRMMPTIGGVPAGSGLQAEAVVENVEPPQVEVEMQNDNLRIYQYADAGDKNTAVYFVVSEGLEL